MTCPVCGTEFNVNTKLKNGVYRCPNPNCTAPYITEKREPSNLTLAVIFLLIAVAIFFGFAFYAIGFHILSPYLLRGYSSYSSNHCSLVDL